MIDWIYSERCILALSEGCMKRREEHGLMIPLFYEKMMAFTEHE
jgi:hypothetical protein